MKRMTLLVAALVVALSGASLAQASAGPWVSAYYAGWFWDWTGSDPTVAVNAVDMTTMTHFIFGRYAPGAGTLGGSAGQLVEGAGTGHTQVEDPLIAKAHANGVKALMMIGGAGDGAGFDASTVNSTIRATFIANVLAKCVAKNYDGVDVDWEDAQDTAAQQSQMISLLTELRTAAATRARYQPPNAPFIITFPGYTLNINTDLPVPAWKVTVASLVDQYNLMSYGQNYDFGGWQTWFFGALKGAGGAYPTSIESSIQGYVDAGVPRGKLGLGIGLYGNGYTPPVTGPRQTISTMWGGDDTINTWEDFYSRGMFSGGTYTFDAAAQTGYYTYSPARAYRGVSVSMLTTEDLQSIAAKGAWAKAGNAGGTIVWTINYGYVATLGTNPPMNQVKAAFLPPPPAADLSITKTDGQTTAAPGQVRTYTIVVSNAGPSAATGATVADTVPAALIGATWTCGGTGGGTCTPAGAGSINDTVNLPVGATATYTLSGTVGANPGSLRNTATVMVPPGMVDPNPANNSATDADTLLCFGEKVVVPDGRLTPSTIAAGAIAWFAASLKIGNSYSVELKNTTGTTTPPPALTLYSGDDGCSVTSPMTPRDTTLIDPGSGAVSRRVSFTAAGTERFFRANLVNGPSPVSFSLAWSDTTLFSPAWSTNGAFDTFYSFQNTTGSALGGTLTLLDTSGAVLSTFDLSIPAGRTASTNTASLSVIRNRTGTARFTHDGPPGAVVAEAAIANFSLSSAYVQPVKFQTMREAR